MTERGIGLGVQHLLSHDSWVLVKVLKLWRKFRCLSVVLAFRDAPLAGVCLTACVGSHPFGGEEARTLRARFCLRPTQPVAAELAHHDSPTRWPGAQQSFLKEQSSRGIL